MKYSFLALHRRAAVGTVVSALVALSSSTAFAQPDPFADYEAQKRGAPLPEVAHTEEPAEVVLPVKRGAFALGLRSAFAYSSTSAESLTGPSETNSTLFLRLAPALEYHVKDNLVVGASFGLLQKSIGREEGSGGRSETSWMPELSAQYDISLTKRLALMPGLGLGLYFGGSDRNLRLNTPGNPVVEESTSTFGVAVTVALRVGYQVSEHLQLRSGLGMFGTIGSESVSSQNVSLGTSSANITLPVELFYTF